jgi:5-methylcytosine-specific restriction endonuclease McrA
MKRISERRKRELEDYDKVKLHVAERDGQLCVRCLHKGKPTCAWDVAHILPRSAFGPKTVHLKHHEKNLVCLCRDCHKATETFNGRVELLNIMRELHGYDYSDEPWSQYV